MLRADSHLSSSQKLIEIYRDQREKKDGGELKQHLNRWGNNDKHKYNIGKSLKNVTKSFLPYKKE